MLTAGTCRIGQSNRTKLQRCLDQVALVGSKFGIFCVYTLYLPPNFVQTLRMEFNPIEYLSMLLLQVELALGGLSVFENCTQISTSKAVGNAVKDQDPRVRAASTWIVAGHALLQQAKKGKQSASAWKALSRLAAGNNFQCKLAPPKSSALQRA